MVNRFWMFITFTILFLVLGGTSFGTRTKYPDDVAIAQRFVGMWRLVSWPRRSADGTTKQSQQSVAYLIYTNTNPTHMCFVAMDPNRSTWKSEFAPTESEAMSAINGSTSYCSTVEIHAKEGFVIHHVEISNGPNAVGRNRKRWFTFDGPNRMSLRIDPAELPPGITDSTLIWERVR